MTTGKEKRRAARAKRIAQRQANEHKVAASLIPVKTGAAENRHENKTNNHAAQEPNNNASAKRPPKRRLSMSGWIFGMSTLLCGLFFAAVFAYWFSESKGNARIGFYWLIPACFFLVAAILSGYWYNVVKPANGTPQQDRVGQQVAAGESTTEKSPAMSNNANVGEVKEPPKVISTNANTAPPSPAASEHTFTASYNVMLLQDYRTLDAAYFLYYRIGREEVVSPIHVATFIRFTNLTPYPLMIDTYAVEIKTPDTDWVRLPRIDVRTGTLYATGPDLDIKTSMRFNFAQSGFDTVIQDRKIAPKETVRGWVFSEMPGDYRGKKISWRFYVKDFSGNDGTEPLGDFRTIDSVQKGARMETFADLNDLTKYRLVYYSEATKQP